MSWRHLRRAPLLALGLATPGAAVLAGLFLAGRIDLPATLVGSVAILVLLAVLIAPSVMSLAAVQEVVDGLGPQTDAGYETAASRRLGRLGGSGQVLWQSALRLNRGWRARTVLAETGRGAAEAVFGAIPDPLILIDAQRRIVRANAAATAFVGFAAEESDLAASLRNPMVLAAADAVLAGRPMQVVDFVLSVPVERVMQARIARLTGGSLGGVAAIITLHDITALEAAGQMRADFVANAGHELKTPLATLVGFIETLLGPARDDAAARDRFLGIMRSEASRMTRLVDDLLSLSRIELNEHVAPTRRVELGPLIEQVADALELRAAERGIRLNLRLPDDLPPVQGDEDELAQVFQNLIDNAIKYGKRQSEITVAADIGVPGPGSNDYGERQTTALAAGNGFVRVSVADRGDGIPSEHLPRLTERFYRIDTARSREMGGTGLGLAIVKHILNRHRGRLEISSTIGLGSTFTIWLCPAAADAPAETVTEQS